jgi:4-hydroxy-tetrahydrodipicolinate reductase
MSEPNGGISMSSRIGIIGSAGRMGRALSEAVVAAGQTLAGGIDRGEDPTALATKSQVLIDFSSPSALEANLDAAVAAGIPILVGTTGLEERHHWLLDQASQSIPVLQTGNTSLGVNMLSFLVEEAAKRLGEDWDIEIVETHHRMKVDAPSGTALLLGQAAAKGREVALADVSVSGRDGITGARESGTIGFAALRGGSVAGDHTVHFLADNERLSFSHLAENRGIFARGAVKGALWLIDKPLGRYGMREVLGL